MRMRRRDDEYARPYDLKVCTYTFTFAFLCVLAFCRSLCVCRFRIYSTTPPPQSAALYISAGAVCASSINLELCYRVVCVVLAVAPEIVDSKCSHYYPVYDPLRSNSIRHSTLNLSVALA